MDKNFRRIVALFVVCAFAGAAAAQDTAPPRVKLRDLVGGWVRLDMNFKDTMEVRSDGTFERNFDGTPYRGHWMRRGTTITFDLHDGNPATIRRFQADKMTTVSRSGLAEDWAKKK